jgi:hypothetical protein
LSDLPKSALYKTPPPEELTMYVVIDIFALLGVISRTSVSTLSAGNTVVAPNGEIRADIDTRKIIQAFIRELKIEYGGPEAWRCSVSLGACFSIPTSGNESVSHSPCFLSADVDFARESIMATALVHGKSGGCASCGGRRWLNRPIC